MRRRTARSARHEFTDEHGLTARQVGRDLFIAALAIVSVAIGAYQILHPAANDHFTFLDAVDLAIVGFFIVDFAWQGSRSGDWGKYLRRHWWEIPSLIPATGVIVASVPGVSVVRAVRVLRLIRVLRLMRIVGMWRHMQHIASYALRIAHRARLFTLLSIFLFIVGLGAVAGFILESDANPRLQSAGDAFWWAFNLMTNVAYVDFQPATVGGRVVAGALELCGIGFIGLFTASLANAIVKEPTPMEKEAFEEASPE